MCTQLWPTFCNPTDCSQPGSSVHGISQGRILEWVAISFSRGFSWSRDQTQVPCTAGRFFYHLSHQGSLTVKGMSVKMLRLDSSGKENPTKFLSSILTWSILYPKKSDEPAESGRPYQKRWHFGYVLNTISGNKNTNWRKGKDRFPSKMSKDTKAAEPRKHLHNILEYGLSRN